jgi:hypothetical protein
LDRYNRSQYIALRCWARSWPAHPHKRDFLIRFGIGWIRTGDHSAGIASTDIRGGRDPPIPEVNALENFGNRQFVPSEV